jgi:hypothetical protein
MSKNNGTPDWQKMLDYNQIDSTQKQHFLKEVMEETAKDIAGKLANDIAFHIREFFKEQKEAAAAGDLLRLQIARAEGDIVIAALAKRFGSYQEAVDSGAVLGIRRRETCNASGFERLEHRFVWMADGTENPLVDVTIDIVHDSFEIGFKSHVGDLKL